MKTRPEDLSAEFEARTDEASDDTVGHRRGVDLIRYAASLFDRCNESINQLFSAEELLRIASACESSGWDFLPDEWTARQLEEAACNRIVPQWREDNRGVPRPVYGPQYE